MTNLISTVFRKKKLLTSTRPPQVLARSFPLIPAISIAGDSVQLLGFDLFGSLTLACNLYMISVRRARVLPLASFRFPVAGDTLAFGCILPTAGRIRDLHPLERALAGRTKKARIQNRFEYALLLCCAPAKEIQTVRGLSRQ